MKLLKNKRGVCGFVLVCVALTFIGDALIKKGTAMILLVVSPYPLIIGALLLLGSYFKNNPKGA